MTYTSDPQAIASRDLFFRVADRLQLEGCLHAVAQESKSVVILSSSAALLDHYGQILVHRLRQHLPNTSTEIFLPTDTDALITRFNGLLEHLSVDAATQVTESCPPQKLWIIHDASSLPEHELKLLLRLLQHLPGARISAVLMQSESPETLRGIDPQGRRILRWEIEPPTLPQIEQFMIQARELGREVAARELVSHVCAGETDMTITASTPDASAAVQTSSGPAIAAAHKEHIADQRAATPPPFLTRKHGLALVVLVLLIFSSAVALWLQTPLAPHTGRNSTPNNSAPATSTASVIATELPEVAEQGLIWLQTIGPEVYVVDHGRFATVQEAQAKIDIGRLHGARVLPHYRDTNNAAQFMVITGPYPTEERARDFTQHIDQNAEVHNSGTVLKLAKPEAN